MPRFIVRVELPGKAAADYAALHKDMWHANFRRVIEGSTGWLHLPHAEYTCSADDWTAGEIRDEVRDIAKQHHDNARVFVTQSAKWASSGLRPVTDADPAPDDS